MRLIKMYVCNKKYVGDFSIYLLFKLIVKGA